MQQRPSNPTTSSTYHPRPIKPVRWAPRRQSVGYCNSRCAMESYHVECLQKYRSTRILIVCWTVGSLPLSSLADGDGCQQHGHTGGKFECSVDAKSSSMVARPGYKNGGLSRCTQVNTQSIIRSIVDILKTSSSTTLSNYHTHSSNVSGTGQFRFSGGRREWYTHSGGIHPKQFSLSQTGRYAAFLVPILESGIS